MIGFFKLITKLFSRKSATAASASGIVQTGTTGEPITCLGCGRKFATRAFPATNGICPKCHGDEFSFLTDEIPDDELAANKELSAGAKFVLDADDRHIKNINGRKLITYLRNQGLV